MKYFVGLLNDEGTLISVALADTTKMVTENLDHDFGMVTLSLNTQNICDNVSKYKIFVVKNHNVVSSLRKNR